jgi:hypothetical protein
MRLLAQRLAVAALAAGAVVVLSGCDELLRTVRELVAILILIVVVALLYLAATSVLIVGIVKLVSDAPSQRWGSAMLVCGTLEGMLALYSLTIHPPRELEFLLFLLAGGSWYVGWRNVREAPREPRSRRRGQNRRP